MKRKSRVTLDKLVAWIFLPAGVLMLISCAAKPTAEEVAAPGKVKAPGETVSIETQQIATEQKAVSVGELKFKKNTTQLSRANKRMIDQLIREAGTKGEIEEVKVISWADVEFPSTQDKSLTPSQREIAENRNEAIQAYINQVNSDLKVKSYSMAERAGAFAEFVGSSDARIKKSLETAGIPTTDSKVKQPSKASKSIVMVVLEQVKIDQKKLCDINKASSFSQNRKMDFKKAVQHINKQGVLLVFPVNNAKEPASLWSQFYPRSKMVWAWDSDGDDRVGRLWMLMKKLSNSGQVVYSKWYQNRATFFSRELFVALLSFAQKQPEESLTQTSRLILEELQSDSPLSTKNLKKILELQGRENESLFVNSMKPLFTKFLIVAYGEVDDGAFPSLAVAAAETIFEDLWREAEALPLIRAQAVIDRFMPEGSKFRKFFDKSFKPQNPELLLL